MSIATSIAIALASHAAAQTAYADKIGIDAGKIQLSGITDNSVQGVISVDEAGDYLLYAWMFGIRKSDGSYFDYEVAVDGKRVGTITPRRGNWQMIGLDEDESVELKPGCHIIEISSRNDCISAPILPKQQKQLELSAQAVF